MGLCTTKILNNDERARQTVTVEMMEKSGIEKHERKKMASTPRVSSSSQMARKWKRQSPRFGQFPSDALAGVPVSYAFDPTGRLSNDRTPSNNT
jgi:hypothetical protein